MMDGTIQAPMTIDAALMRILSRIKLDNPKT
jgi:hypothetical protein